MKAEISQLRFRPDKRYSGVYHEQGRMLTDADLGESVEIAKARLDNVVADIVGDGAPVLDGVVHIGGDDEIAELRPGTIYADGIRGVKMVCQFARDIGIGWMCARQDDCNRWRERRFGICDRNLGFNNRRWRGFNNYDGLLRHRFRYRSLYRTAGKNQRRNDNCGAWQFFNVVIVSSHSLRPFFGRAAPNVVPAGRDDLLVSPKTSTDSVL